MNIRFTVWLTEEERSGIRGLARQCDTSQGFIIRMAVRRMLNMPVSLDMYQPDETQQTGVSK